jgi:hypothetical protein
VAKPILPQGSNVFAGKHGLITPRDLFKWANRGAVSYEQLAENGYMLLGERLRSEAERSVVQKALENIMNVQVTHLPSTPSSSPPIYESQIQIEGRRQKDQYDSPIRLRCFASQNEPSTEATDRALSPY